MRAQSAISASCTPKQVFSHKRAHEAPRDPVTPRPAHTEHQPKTPHYIMYTQNVGLDVNVRAGAWKVRTVAWTYCDRDRVYAHSGFHQEPSWELRMLLLMYNTASPRAHPTTMMTEINRLSHFILSLSNPISLPYL